MNTENVNKPILKRILKAVLQKLGLFRLAVSLYSSISIQTLRAKPSNFLLRSREINRGTPVPSSELLVLVAGTADVRWFLRSGKKGFDSIKEILNKNQIELNDLSKILDFGCGCGRVMRHWRHLKKGQLFGTDYNPDLIVWCRNNLPFASFDVNNLTPPLNYENEEFDFVYALSVLTHLPEDVQFSWMQELKRIIKPGGYLLVTVHGAYYVNQLSDTEAQQFHNDQLVVRSAQASGTNLCATFHPEKYVRDKLSDGFSVVDFIPCGAQGNPMQDVYLMMKK